MNDTLKVAGRIGAELGAAKAENERLRGLLATLRVSLNLDDTEYGLSQQEKRKLAADIDAELSRQPEPMCETMQRPKAECGCPDCGSSLIDWPTADPTDTFTAVDMATAAAQGFRDGRAAVEQAAAQDEREACEAAFPPEEGVDWNEAKQRYEAFTAFDRGMQHAVDWQEHTLEVWRKAIATRPAQTEQQPAAWQCRCVCEECVDAEWSQCSFEQYQMALADPDMQARALYAAPIAQTAHQPEQSGLVDALTQLLCWAEKQVCTHEETHRGGAIWEICDSCGAKWADDEGGRPAFVWPKAISNASAALSAQGENHE